LIRKLGLTLIAAAALPLIETVIMPARAQMGLPAIATWSAARPHANAGAALASCTQD
jgi:hypothetical protein